MRKPQYERWNINAHTRGFLISTSLKAESILQKLECTSLKTDISSNDLSGGLFPFRGLISTFLEVYFRFKGLIYAKTPSTTLIFQCLYSGFRRQPLEAAVDLRRMPNQSASFISTMMVVLRGSGFPPSRLSAFILPSGPSPHCVLQLWLAARVSLLTPVGVRSTSLLEGPPGLLLTLRPAIVVSLRGLDVSSLSRLSASFRWRWMLLTLRPEIQLAPGFVDGDGCAVGEV